MTDNINNNNPHLYQKPAMDGHLQDTLVKDSITHNQNITAQAQARQSHVANAMLDIGVENSKNNDFTRVQDLPTGTPQGQQTTMPNNTTSNNVDNASAKAQAPSKRFSTSVMISIILIRLRRMVMKKRILAIRPSIRLKNKHVSPMFLPQLPKIRHHERLNVFWYSSSMEALCD